ncbi:MAG: dTDP-4-dehydrorhamnose 3,5-epimerase [Candidatus Eremiobacteraeota bacterium]|nr:dTDP-4-dehydrorhamnose 3,5-epimerase [Candidatus Eremiobacteraeota bacterium]
MVKLDTNFSEAKIFIPDVFEDDRGFFKETYNEGRYRVAGLSDVFVQDSVSFSTRNVIRGLHYDAHMAKLVNVLRGRIWDVIADMRPGSATFGAWQGFYLNESNHKQLYVPAGFAHGFLALSDDVIFSYKHSALYDPGRQRAVRWNDPTLAIDWPLVDEPRLSRQDADAPWLDSV